MSHTKPRTTSRAATVAAAAALALGTWTGPTGVGTAASGSDTTTVATSTSGLTVTASDDGVTARPSAARAAAPTEVRVGTRIAVSGVVPVRARRARPVVLQEQSGNGTWSAVTSVRSTRGGVFRMTTSAGTEVTSRVLRAYAPRTPRLPRFASAQMTVRVVAAPAAPAPPTPGPATGWDPAEAPSPGESASAGSATDWTFLFDGGGRWDPCSTIDWVYDARGSYSGSLQDMTRAFARIAGRTGLHFRYAGATDAQATGGQAPDGVEIVVSWATAAQEPDLAGSVVGVGGASGTSVRGADVKFRLLSGRIHLDSEGALRPGFTTSGDPTWGQVMEHEALHVLGLGHASGRSQLMYGAAHSGNHLAGAGDAAGMRRIGADQVCLGQ